MTYVLNDASVLSASGTTKTVKSVADGEGFWPRLYAAIIESRRRSAMRELRAHAFRFDEAGMLLGGIPSVTLTNDRELPFNR